MIADTNILFAGLSLPELDCKQALDEVAKVPLDQWFWDQYRCTSMLPLMTRDGLGVRESLYNLGPDRSADYIWTPACPASIVDYFETHVFTWMKPKPRVTLLKTAARRAISPHIDCQRDEFGTRQLKFRYVLQGDVDSLFFITESGNVRAPSIQTPFLIDGSWPHGMDNQTDGDKITICVGAPWTGALQYPDFGPTLLKSDWELPNDFARYFRQQLGSY